MSLTPAIPRNHFARERGVPHLFQVLDCAFPFRPPARHSLAGVDEVLLGRGDGATRDGATLRLGIADASMSTTHARLRRTVEGFSAEDCGSTNGSFVNGSPIGASPLADGDLLEMGHTHFMFRADVPQGALAAAAHPALATLSAALVAELASVPAIARPLLPVMIGGDSGT